MNVNMQFSPAYCQFLPLGQNIFFSTLFSNTPNLCSSLNVKDKVLRTHKTTGTVLVLCILILNSLESSIR
jgi:hypothetical protein